MDSKEAINSIGALHVSSTNMLLALARGQGLSPDDLEQIKFFPRLALVCLIACGGRVGARDNVGALDATEALHAVHRHTSGMLGIFARWTPNRALDNCQPHILHTLTLELCAALRLEPK